VLSRFLERRWLIWPVLGVLAGAAYTLMPSTGSAAALSALVGVSAVTLIAIGVRRLRGRGGLAWLIFMAGQILWVAGDVAYARAALTQPAVPFPSVADFLYLSAYPPMVVALFLLTRDRGPRDLARLLDTAVIATGLGLVYWVFFIGPIAADATLPVATRFVMAASPTVGVLLFAVVMPLVVRAGRRTPSVWLLTLGSAVTVTGNTAYTLVPYVHPIVMPLIYGGFLFAYCCFAGAALHPSARTLAGTGRRESFGKGRLALLAASTLLVPAVLFIEGRTAPDRIDWLAVGIGSVVLFLLVLGRMFGFVTKVQLQAGQLEELAMRDELTGLANRRLFEERLGVAVAGGRPQVAMLDLNGFKDVNDRLGHAVGDRLLMVVAARLAGALREGDLVARMGGDEFAVLLPDATAERMTGVVERLTAALRKPVEVDGQELLIGASFGSSDSAGTDDPVEVLRRADVAMYVAKGAGDGGHRRYAVSMDDQSGEQVRLGAELRAALDTGQFRLVYQPIVSLPDARIVSVEALIRWNHPTRGFISPAEFIPVAEQNGLIVELGAWILRTACAQATTWRQSLGDAAPQRISVNVSARQLAEPGFTDLVAHTLAWTGLGAHHLVIEVTETAVFGGGQAVQAVKDLHNLGVRIALDDFGTGHSSLGLLHTVPVDVLKVDKSFVDNITMAGRHSVIATALIQVSHGLGLTAVAEGVETAEQADELHRLGYRLAQGYYFGKPVAEPDFGTAARRVAARA
jgi:diguanylate cyclase